MKSIIKDNRKFMISLSVFSIILILFNLASRTNSYNTTTLAFSYKYGFIPRGLIGTLYQGLNYILPIDLNCYRAVNNYTLIITILFAICTLLFVSFILRNTTKDNRYVKALIVFFIICAIPTFSGYYNFGRLDLYMVLLSFLSVVLIVRDRAIWLVIPISMLNVMIHEGYVFMYFNIILVLLFYKLITCIVFKNKSEVKKYLVVFILSFVFVSAIFLYFRLAEPAGEYAYEQIKSVANGMCKNNKCHNDLVRAEILGVDLTSEEWLYHVQNIIELPIFLVLFSPFIVVCVIFFVKLIKACDNKLNKLKYIAVSIGALTTLPLFIMKVDYGRWVFAVIAYYAVVIMALMAMKDENVIQSFDNTIEVVNEKCHFAILLLPYAMLFSPFTDLAICKFTYRLYDFAGMIENYF